MEHISNTDIWGVYWSNFAIDLIDGVAEISGLVPELSEVFSSSIEISNGDGCDDCDLDGCDSGGCDGCDLDGCDGCSF